MIKIAIRILPIGNNILLTRKSVASKMLLPKIDTSFKILSARAEGIAAINMIIPRKMAEIALGTPLSFKAATIISYKLNEDVNVANKNNNKKIDKNACPNSNCAKAAGNTINKSSVPSVRSNPNATTPRKIAGPASRDTKIFLVTTLSAEVVTLTSFSKSELYVPIHESPTAREKKDCPNAYNT